MKKTNYHTHHYRCNHAVGTIEDYIKSARDKGLNEIGMSCHVPYEDGRTPYDRMKYSDLNTYLNEIDKVKNEFKDIKILKAFECEYYWELHDYYVKLSKRTDYLILGHHFVTKENGELVDVFFLKDKECLNLYKEAVVKGIKTKLFKILAHPDLFLNNYGKWDEECKRVSKEILEACLENNVAIEYNANGLRKNRNYPNHKFWEYVSENYRNVPVVVSSDAHNPEYLDDEFVKQGIKDVKKLNLNYKEALEF